jgi:hypothetical protein
MRAPHVPGVGRDRERRLGRGLHEQIVDSSLVLVGDVGDRRRHRVDDVEIADGQQLGLALGEPLACGCASALGTMPVAAGNGELTISCLMESLSLWEYTALHRVFTFRRRCSDASRSP